MIFRLTDAGRAAIADSANARTNQVVLTHMALGDGMAQPGIDDSGRAALRNERVRDVLVAVAGGAARLGVRASFTGSMGDPAWNATEVGVIARVGADPAFLAAYGAAAAGEDPFAVVAPGVAATVAATVDIVASDAAVAVMVAPDLTVVGASTFPALLDTPDALEALAYYRANAAGQVLEAMSAANVLSDLLSGLADGNYPRVRVAGGMRSLVGLTAAQLVAELTVLWSLPDAGFVIPQGSWETVATLAAPAGWQVRGAVRVSPSSHARYLRLLDASDAELWSLTLHGSQPGVIAQLVPTLTVPGAVRLQGRAPNSSLGLLGGPDTTFLRATAF